MGSCRGHILRLEKLSLWIIIGIHTQPRLCTNISPLTYIFHCLNSCSLLLYVYTRTRKVHKGTTQSKLLNTSLVCSSSSASQLNPLAYHNNLYSISCSRIVQPSSTHTHVSIPIYETLVLPRFSKHIYIYIYKSIIPPSNIQK